MKIVSVEGKGGVRVRDVERRKEWTRVGLGDVEFGFFGLQDSESVGESNEFFSSTIAEGLETAGGVNSHL